MDIGELSIEMHQASISQTVGVSLIKEAMNSSEESSQALIKGMELSVNPNVGCNIDVSV